MAMQFPSSIFNKSRTGTPTHESLYGSTPWGNMQTTRPTVPQIPQAPGYAAPQPGYPQQPVPQRQSVLPGVGQHGLTPGQPVPMPGPGIRPPEPEPIDVNQQLFEFLQKQYAMQSPKGIGVDPLRGFQGIPPKVAILLDPESRAQIEQTPLGQLTSKIADAAINSFKTGKYGIGALYGVLAQIADAKDVRELAAIQQRLFSGDVGSTIF